MTEKTAQCIIFCLFNGHTLRRISEIFSTECPDNQLEGASLVEDACKILNLNLQEIYLAQSELLDYKAALSKVFDKKLSEEYNKYIKNEIPTWKDIMDFNLTAE